MVSETLRCENLNNKNKYYLFNINILAYIYIVITQYNLLCNKQMYKHINNTITISIKIFNVYKIGINYISYIFPNILLIVMMKFNANENKVCTNLLINIL